jgi:two-component system sensor kinase FixL
LRKRMRDSGVSQLGRISWGTHVCVFYDSVSQMFEILIPYYRSGLENNEKCIWICSGSSRKQEAEDALKAAVPGVEQHIASGQMTVLTHDEFYTGKGGGFCPQRVTRQWKDLLDLARAEGYEGLRVSGDTSWIDRSIWDSFCAYERNLYGSIDHERMLVICCYPLKGDWCADTIDVLSSHQYALVRKEHGWEAIRCGLRREERWEALFDEISEGVLVTDETGLILAANRAALNYFGVDALAHLGESIGELSRRFSLRSESGDEVLSIPSLMAGQEPAGAKRRFLARSKEGCPLDLLVHAREIEKTSMSTRRFLVLLEDLTAVLSMERTKERAVHILAHELRNPLQVLKAVVRLLDDAPSRTNIRRYVATLKKQIDSLSCLIEDLLLAFRTDSDRLTITRKPMDLTRLVVDCVDGPRALCNHEIIALYPPDQRVPVFGDETRLRQIFTNLLRNASTYTPHGKKIWIDIRSVGGRVLVTVEDEGIGIPEGENDLVFNAFFRASNSSLASTEGMGLGLYISRQLARLHGGDLWAQGRPGGGTIVTLSLPLYAGES